MHGNSLQLSTQAFKRKDGRKITWPDGMGIEFGNLINDVFERKSVGIDAWGSDQRKLWDKSCSLREKYVEAAWKIQPDRDVAGLRRGSILRAMAADLGLTGQPDTAKLVSSAPRDSRKALHATILWIDELYNYNLASRFQVRSYFPVGKGVGTHMMPGLVTAGTGVSDLPGVPKRYREHEVTWPTDRVLLTASPDKLVGIRADASGEEYIDAMKLFHKEPCDENWEDFKFAMDVYAAKICEAVTTSVETTRRVRYDRIDAGMAAGGATAAGVVDAAFAMAGMPPPFTTVGVISAALVATAVYSRKLLTGKAGRGMESLPTEGREIGEGRKTGDIRIDLPG
jgi:hypothetical protein